MTESKLHTLLFDAMQAELDRQFDKARTNDVMESFTPDWASVQEFADMAAWKEAEAYLVPEYGSDWQTVYTGIIFMCLERFRAETDIDEMIQEHNESLDDSTVRDYKRQQKRLIENI